MEKKFLLIGKLRSVSNPTNAGGVIVLFEQLINNFNERGANFRIIDLNNRNYLIKFFSVIIIYVKLLFCHP